jgi:hypothetical protein
MTPTSGGKSMKFPVFLVFLQTKLKGLRSISLGFRVCSCGVPKKISFIQQVRYVPALYNIS